MYKLIESDDKFTMAGVNELGNYNNAPSPIVPCDEKTFWGMFNHYSPKYTESRQLTKIEPGKTVCVQILWFNDCGFMFEKNRDGVPTRYWRIGCEHEFTSQKLGRCYYSYTCKKCEYKTFVDSSD